MSARQLLRQATGLDVSAADAERAVRARMAQLGVGDSGAYLRALAGDELSALIELVVVPESWMFRDAGAFSAATGFVQRRLAAQPGRPLRILSLPCAGGEEPYSMAMALDAAGVAPHAVRIDAYDLSHLSIRRAIAGRYTRNAFRGADLAFRDRYFSADGDNYQLCDAIRAHVAFRQGNLFEIDCGAEAGRYDVVFCRNLMIYFDEPTAHAASDILRTLLNDAGLLFAGYAEVPAFSRHGFAALRLPGAFALQKASALPAPDAPPRRKRVLRPEPPTPQPQAGAAAPAPDPAPAATPGQLARRQADQGDYRAAAATCHAWLAAEPDAAEAYFILGVVSECQQQDDAAAGFWRRCVYLQPGHYEALCHLALLAERSGDNAGARTWRQRAARIYERRASHGSLA